MAAKVYLFFVNGPIPNGTLHVHLWSYGLTKATACACPLSPRDRGVSHSSLRSLCALYPNFCRGCTGARSTADFYPTVKAALHHESADTEEDREGLGCHLGQGQCPYRHVSFWTTTKKTNVFPFYSTTKWPSSAIFFPCDPRLSSYISVLSLVKISNFIHEL